MRLPLAKKPPKRFPNCLALVRPLTTARNPAKLDAGILDKSVNGSRPKTMADTMEDIQLEGFADEVDLGGSAPQSEDGEAVSHLGITVAQPSTGALRPTLVLCLGTFERQ